jgi:lipopolysaccharide biosynthesis regulator YciM
MPQSFHPLNMEDERTLLVKGEEITPQVARASKSRVPRVHVHQENTQFSTDQLMECQLQMHEVVQKLVNTLLFSFQDLKLNTKDIIIVLKDTLNTTLGPLPIPYPHVIGVPSNTLERHSIGSCVVDGVCDLITNSRIIYA